MDRPLAEIIAAISVVVSGNPDPAKICTSHGERKPHDEDADSRTDAANECGRPKDGELSGRYRIALRLLQAVPDSWLTTRDNGDGSWAY